MAKKTDLHYLLYKKMCTHTSMCMWTHAYTKLDVENREGTGKRVSKNEMRETKQRGNRETGKRKMKERRENRRDEEEKDKKSKKTV